MSGEESGAPIAVRFSKRLAVLIGIAAIGTLGAIFPSDPPPPIEVNNGQRIIVESEDSNQKCRIALLDEEYAITAGHCGQSGSRVRSENGTILGAITKNLLYTGKHYDASLIHLSENSVGKTSPSLEQAPPLHGADKIWSLVDSDKFVTGTWAPSETVRKTMSLPSWGGLEVTVIEGKLAVQAGDSGAPVFDSRNNLVGIIQGGNAKGMVNITPVSSMLPLFQTLSAVPKIK